MKFKNFFKKNKKIENQEQSDDVTIEKLKKLKWWDLPFDKIKDLPFENVDECIKILELRCK